MRPSTVSSAENIRQRSNKDRLRPSSSGIASGSSRIDSVISYPSSLSASSISCSASSSLLEGSLPPPLHGDPRGDRSSDALEPVKPPRPRRSKSRHARRRKSAKQRHRLRPNTSESRLRPVRALDSGESAVLPRASSALPQREPRRYARPSTAPVWKLEPPLSHEGALSALILKSAT